MLSKFDFDTPGIVPFCHDIKEPLKEFNNSFNRIISRMAFHHMEDVLRGLNNCKEMLTPDGVMIIQEGVPPSESAEVVSWFSHMMAIKEKRQVFTESSLKELFEKAGFKRIRTKTVIDDNFSVLNWLTNSGQSPLLLKRVYQAHKTAPESIKRLYNMKEMDNGDIILQSKSILIKGAKS
jgi:SAM-dependent methyltransferase